VVLTVRENGTTKVIAFSGDLGPLGAPILRDFAHRPRPILVIQETTYGDRDHRSWAETIAELKAS